MKSKCRMLIPFLILVICINSTATMSMQNKPGINYSTQSIVHFSNFANFNLFSNSGNVTSTKTTDQINFFYNGTSDESIEREQYLYLLSEQNGNCSDFYIEAIFNYTMLDNDDYLTFRIFAGSLYFENGTYAGIYPAGSGGSPSKLVGSGITDSWVGSSGVYTTIAYPDNIKDSEATAIDSLPLNGSVKIQLARDGADVYSSVSDYTTETTQLNSTWFQNTSRDVHYILIDFYSGTTLSQANLSLIYINASLAVDGLPITYPTNLTELFPLSTLTISLSVVISFSILFLYRKKKKSH